jgi:hypothetical protein
MYFYNQKVVWVTFWAIFSQTHLVTVFTFLAKNGLGHFKNIFSQTHLGSRPDCEANINKLF